MYESKILKIIFTTIIRVTIQECVKTYHTITNVNIYT